MAAEICQTVDREMKQWKKKKGPMGGYNRESVVDFGSVMAFFFLFYVFATLNCKVSGKPTTP